MKGFKKLLIVVLGIIFVFFLFLLWYQHQYSMDVIEPYTINSPSFEKKLLIATQGSEFKDKVTTGIVNHYTSDAIYIQIIDIEELQGIDPKDFNALVIIHTWEYSKLPVAVKAFIDRTENDRDKIVVLTTSGEGTYKVKDVDAIAGESILEDAPVFVKEIISRLDSILKAN